MTGAPIPRFAWNLAYGTGSLQATSGMRLRRYEVRKLDCTAALRWLGLQADMRFASPAASGFTGDELETRNARRRLDLAVSQSGGHAGVHRLLRPWAVTRSCYCGAPLGGLLAPQPPDRPSPPAELHRAVTLLDA